MPSAADLCEIQRRQIDRLLGLGFHTRRGLSPQAYADRFPEVAVQPPGFVGRFDMLVVVEADPRVGLRCQHDAVGVIEHVDSDRLTTAGFQPQVPYCVWVQDGSRYADRSIADAKASFADDEVPCSQLEVSSLFIHHPELFRGRGIDSGSTVYQGEYFSTLLWVSDSPELASHHANDFTPGLSVLSRGRIEGE
jgi:hypothetical protein